jgi:hypothetical protein
VLRSKWMPVSRRRLKEAKNKYLKLRRAVGAPGADLRRARTPRTK